LTRWRRCGWLAAAALALAALVAEKPRRGGLVSALLAAAGLLRPEAWLLSGTYALWLMYDEKRLPSVLLLFGG
jgi:hypothetical protein